MTNERHTNRVPLPQSHEETPASAQHDSGSVTLTAYWPDVDRGASASRQGDIRSAYVHIPFCFHKCHYCDFYSIVDDREERRDAFVKRMLVELDAWRDLLDISNNEGAGEREHGDGRGFHTIFVGGGTPTLLGPDRLSRLLPALRDGLGLVQSSPSKRTRKRLPTRSPRCLHLQA